MTPHKPQSIDGGGMIDIGRKPITPRVAIARGIVQLSARAFSVLKEHRCPKGAVLETARTAGILAAKQTPTLIPYCHPLMINKVIIHFKLDETNSKLEIKAEVSCDGKTGVEMEALTAVSVAALTVYDMMKCVDKGINISDIQLIKKTGGKSGDYRRP